MDTHMCWIAMLSKACTKFMLQFGLFLPVVIFSTNASIVGLSYKSNVDKSVSSASFVCPTTTAASKECLEK